ncbi:TPA: helix-turn-helix transcriptional regulator [Vibrio parahaemolyticus]|nr:helix-turn-helix transcriptional regulator [Vibrio parahaemolyticus]HCG5507745.1 helix-turn-helix transcriptional regulator [Vibrio parahaemolyticus]
MEYVNMSIGEVLKDRRIELSIKQDDLADRMDVTVQTVSKWERGITEPKASQVAQLSSILKLNEKEICQGKRGSSSIEPFDFLKMVSSCMRDVSETELILTIYDHLEDPEGFMFALSEKSSVPFFTHKEKQKDQARTMLELYKNGSIQFSNEEEKERCLSAWEQTLKD